MSPQQTNPIENVKTITDEKLLQLLEQSRKKSLEIYPINAKPDNIQWDKMERWFDIQDLIIELLEEGYERGLFKDGS